MSKNPQFWDFCLLKICIMLQFELCKPWNLTNEQKPRIWLFLHCENHKNLTMKIALKKWKFSSKNTTLFLVGKILTTVILFGFEILFTILDTRHYSYLGFSQILKHNVNPELVCIFKSTTLFIVGIDKKK